jgi:hypothetical protein
MPVWATEGLLAWLVSLVAQDPTRVHSCADPFLSMALGGGTAAVFALLVAHAARPTAN